MRRSKGLTTARSANLSNHWLALLAPLSLLLSAQLDAAQAAEAPWKSGAELEWQLESPVGVRWGSNPLRAALTNLARSQAVAIFLDRRVDPEQTIDLVRADLTLRELLQQLAEQQSLGVGQVGPVIYLGPPQTAAVLGTVAAQKEDQLQRLPTALRSRLQRAQPQHWPELSTPRELIATLSGGVGLQVEGLEQVPHDLWPEVDLPALTFAQALSLVLAGFELTFDYVPETAAIRLAPLPTTASITRRIPLRGSPAAVGAEIRRRFPDARFTIEAGEIVVDATIEVADRIQRLLAGAASRPRPPAAKAKAEKRYTLRVQDKPLGAVAAAIAKETGVELRFDPRVEDLRDKLVWLEVQDVSLDQLLKTLLEPGGLTYQLDEQTLEIRPAAAP
jgi:hypothetical protein